MRPRGRRPGGNARADELIAKAVYQLEGWGFTLAPDASQPNPAPDGAFEAVAFAALKVLRRGDTSEEKRKKPLSWQMVKTIYDKWWTKHDLLWRTWQRKTMEGEDVPEPAFMPTKWSNFTAQSRRDQIPYELSRHSLSELSELLLSEAIDLSQWSEWRRPPLDPTDKFLELLRAMPAPARVRAAWNWKPKRGRPIKRRLR